MCTPVRWKETQRSHHVIQPWEISSFDHNSGKMSECFAQEAKRQGRHCCHSLVMGYGALGGRMATNGRRALANEVEAMERRQHSWFRGRGRDAASRVQRHRKVLYTTTSARGDNLQAQPSSHVPQRHLLPSALRNSIYQYSGLM